MQRFSIPIAGIIPTLDRPQALSRMLHSLLAQDTVPAQMIVVDASADDRSRNAVIDFQRSAGPACDAQWLRATTRGAAAQRNQGVTSSSQPFVWFIDDDVIFEPECVRRQWEVMSANPGPAGASAMITNQRYQRPGVVSRALFVLLAGKYHKSFAGKVLGPAVNLLPEDDDDLPEAVPVEWLNTTCTMYRRELLPDPPFDPWFSGYSLMEDLALSIRVGRSGRLLNARTARIFHDSQPASYKADVENLARMELLNRHYVMTELLGRNRMIDFMKLALWELFQLASVAARRQTRATFPATIRGKRHAVSDLIRRSK